MDAAREVIDEEGLEALTMRRLADRLGLQLPVIYRRFRSKQVLLDHVAEAILTEAVQEPPPSADWETKAVTLAHGLRQAILAQRDGARILGGSYTARQNTMAFADRLLGILKNAGFRNAQALWATTTLFCYVLGETLEQQGSADGAIEALQQAISPQAFPHLSATPVQELLNFDQRFTYGLTVLTSGLHTILDTDSQAIPPNSTSSPD